MSSVLFFFHMLGLAMAVGAGFSMITLGRATARMDPPERAKYMMRAFAIVQMGGEANHFKDDLVVGPGGLGAGITDLDGL